MNRLVLFWLAGVWIPSLVMAGQQADGEMAMQGLEGDFLLRVYDTTEGLFPTYVRSVAQTGDGYIWLAAFDGVVRFDGIRAITYSGKNSACLPAPMQTMLVQADRQNRLWCATAEGRVFSFDRLVWREHTKADGWPGLAIESIAEAPDGAVLFAGERKLVRFEAGRFAEVALPASLASSRTQLKVLFDTAGRLWALNQNGVWRKDGAEWTPVFSASDPGSAIQGAAPARDGGVWVATADEIRKLLGNGTATVWPRPQGFRNDEVRLLEDFRGNLWVGGASSGLRIWMADGRVLVAGDAGATARPQISCLLEDRERNVLVGTRGAGLARIKPRPFHVSLGSLGGLVGTLVNSVCDEGPGKILVGTEGAGLHRISRERGDELVVSADGSLGATHRITSLLRLQDGAVLVAVAGSGLFQLQGDSVSALPLRLPAGTTVRVMFEDSRGRTWIGHDGGLAVGVGGEFRAFPDDGGPALSGVRAIAEDRAGVVWTVGKQGLGRVRDGGVDLVPLPEVLANVNLLGLHADGAGSLWIGAENVGLARFREGGTFIYTGAHGLPVSSIGAIVEEGAYFWLAGEKGLVRVSRKSLDAVAEGRSVGLELQVFNRGDGLPSDAFRRGYQPSATRASDGRIWFSSHKGAVSVDPSHLVTAVYEPPAVIEEVRAELELIPVTQLNRERIEVAAGVRRMSIRCTTPSLGKPEHMRFRYRLEGPGSAWQDFGTERLIRFNDLKPGRYRYSVWAIGTDGRLVEPATWIRMTIQPAYWQTVWFRVLVVAGLVGAGGVAAWRIQQRRIVERDQRLRQQEERAGIEEQLHQSQKMEAIGRLAGGIAHDFNNLLTIINGNAEILRIEFTPGMQRGRIVSDILKAGERARDLVNQILTFSREQPVALGVADIAPSLRDAARLLRAGISATTEIGVDIPETLPPVLADPAQIQRLLMNLGTNAAQAVGPAGASIRIKAEDFLADDAFSRAQTDVAMGRYVRLTVEDNGRGMDDKTIKRIFEPFYTTKGVGKGTGLGLAVVHGIVKAHDGVITVRSGVDAGTAFHVYLPVASGAVLYEAPGDRVIRAGKGELVLVVDDEPAVVNVARIMLERTGYRVEAQVDPERAVAVFAEAPDRYRVVITDLAMPGCNGVELARRIWGIRAGTPIILCTGFGGSIGPDAAADIGFSQLLSKPFEARTLSEAVARVLAPAAPMAGA